MSSGPNKISRSPTRPEPDDDGEEWPVHGIVGEDVDVFGISRYSLYCCSHWQYRTELKPPVTRQAQALSFSHSTLRIDNHLRYTQNWTRPDGTNTTWMRDIEGDPAIIASWNEAMKNQRLEKAMETQSIDLNVISLNADARQIDVRACTGGRGEDGRTPTEGCQCT
jgi:histone-lysine N-methyltransferase SUV39H